MEQSIKELEGLVYTEYIDLKNALKILQNWDKIIQTLPEERQKKIKEQALIFDPLINLKKMCKDKNDIIHTKYDFSKNLQTYGRLFAKNSSLQGLPREIRNSLAFGKYYDIDMKNAHPTLLSQYCSFNGIKCSIVDEYVKNRDQIISKICADNEITKDKAKYTFLSILNGGKCEDIKGDYIDKFKTEIVQIHKNICALNPDEYKKVKRQKNYNVEGSMMNVILCKLEHNILMNSVNFMKSRGFNVDVLVFDGFMVRKEDNKLITDQVLHELQEHIKTKTGYNMTFVEKSLNYDLDLAVYSDPLLDERPAVSYYKDKEEFEKTHLKIIHPVMYVTIKKDGTYDYQAEEKIKASYKHLKSTILNEKNEVFKTSFINNWLNDEHIRRYDSMVFVPPPTPYDKSDYNTWIDFAQEKVELPKPFNIKDNKYVKTYNEFLLNLFNNNTDYVNYYNAWCANIIQNPGKRSMVCMVLYSNEEGVGKNMSTITLELCVGSNYTTYITDVGNQLFGKHSSAELNKLLLVLNEVKGKDTYSNTDLFKTRITDDKREVELKGKDTFQITNYCSYILNTNNLNAVNAGDKDRRFCVLPCVNPRINDKEYFDEYRENINENPEAIRCIYEYLKTYNIEAIVPRRLFAKEGVRPKSDMYKELQECNRDKEWDLLEDIVRANLNKEDMIMTYDDLWYKFKSYCLNNNYEISKLGSKRFQYLFSQNILTFLNNKANYKDTIMKDRNSKSRFYKFDLIKLREYFQIDNTDDEDTDDEDTDDEDI